MEGPGFPHRGPGSPGTKKCWDPGLSTETPGFLISRQYWESELENIHTATGVVEDDFVKDPKVLAVAAQAQDEFANVRSSDQAPIAMGT